MYSSFYQQNRRHDDTFHNYKITDMLNLTMALEL